MNQTEYKKEKMGLYLKRSKYINLHNESFDYEYIYKSIPYFFHGKWSGSDSGQTVFDYKKYKVSENNPDYKFVASTVIGRDAADVFGSFTLNVGTTDGVSVNCPVIYGEYLIGVVKEANPTTCVVHTILNPQVNVSAYEIRTGEIGYVNTTTALSLEQMCRLSGLDGNSTVTTGGIVCTSGIGGIYPRGLIIGTVTTVEADEANVSSNTIVVPDIDLSNLQDVFIITDFEEKS